MRLRKGSIERAKKVYGILVAEPGLNMYLLAARMGIQLKPRTNYGAVESLLLTCQSAGYQISEDGEGRLYAFGEWGLSGDEFMRG